MVVLFTGMSGIEISGSLFKYCNEHKYFRNPSNILKKPEILKIDTEMEEVFYELNPTEDRASNVWVEVILHQSYPVLEKLWIEAFDKISTKVKDIQTSNSVTPIFINLHSCYLHSKTKEYIPLISIDKLRELNPKMVITLIDDIYDIHSRLTKIGGIYHGVEPTMIGSIQRYFRLLDWRSNETMMSRFLANHLGCKNFVFAVKHSYETLTNLIFEDYPKAYLSHPISEVRRLERMGKVDDARNIKSEITEISDYLNANFTTFLPTTIDEYRVKSKTTQSGDNGQNGIKSYFPSLTERWEKDIYKKPHNILFLASGFNDIDDFWKKETPEDIDPEASNLLTILVDAISDQVSTRDYTLVEQSDVIIIYRPLFNGNGSRGVLEEFYYYRGFNKDLKKEVKCYIYCPQSDINKYYENVFNKAISDYIDRHLFKTKLGGPTFVGITSEEGGKLFANFNSKSLILDLITEVMDNHKLVLIVSEQGTPLSASEKKVSLEKFVNKVMNDFSLVEEYEQGATLFIRQDMTVVNFCNKIS